MWLPKTNFFVQNESGNNNINNNNTNNNNLKVYCEGDIFSESLEKHQ